MAKSYLKNMESVGEIASALSIWMSNTPEEKYRVLLESSPVKRMEIMESMVYEYLEMAKLTGEARAPRKMRTRRRTGNRPSSGRWNFCNGSWTKWIRKAFPIFANSRRKSKRRA